MYLRLPLKGKAIALKLGSTQSLVDTKKQQLLAIKQGNQCDGVWRDQPWSIVGLYPPNSEESLKLSVPLSQALVWWLLFSCVK